MKKFSLPSLLASPQVFCTFIFNKKSYNFKFRWCDSFCLLDIYLIEDGETVYLVKGRPMVVLVNIAGRVKDKNLIDGELVLENKFGNNTAPTRNNFHTDFELVYYGED